MEVVQRRRAAFEDAKQKLRDLLAAAEEAGAADVATGATEALNSLAALQEGWEADQKGSSRS